jgi:dienelactone hydrolase
MRPLGLLALATAVLVGFAAPAGAAPPLRLETRTSTVTVLLDGRSFPARVVRPTRAGTYPVVAFGHGFLQTSARYRSTLVGIASRGYVVVAPDSEEGFRPDHGQFADDLQLALRWARAHLPGSSRTLDAVVGHSMGGGAALLAADRYPAIDTVATLAAAETSPSARDASTGITVPALFVVGSEDGIVDPATTRAMFGATPAPATFASIVGGYHCGFADSTALGGLGCDSGSIPRATQLRITRGLLGDWLDARFRGAPWPARRTGVVLTRK